MSKDNKWLLMTYYCPTHGSLDRSEPIELSRDDLKDVRKRFKKNSNY